MAAAFQPIRIDPGNTGLWRVQQTPAAAARVSALLQDDLARHHVFFNADGFHNHIPHLLLSLYGTGADADALQLGYDRSKGYQRAARPAHEPPGGGGSAGGAAAGPSTDDADWYATAGPRHLGHESYYADFLQFFRHDMARRDAALAQAQAQAQEQDGAGLAGWQAVVRDRLFSGTPAAEDLRARLFAGFLHPLLQLMYGLEWAQPAVVAQGLAQAAVHKPQGVDTFLFDAEKAAAADAAAAAAATPDRSIVSLYEEVARSPALAAAVRWSDPNKVRHGVLARAREAMVAVAAKVTVPATEEGLAARTAEMAEASVYVAASAALHPTKYPKMDFFLIHHVTSIPFFVVLNSFAWLPVAARARMLEWKIRMDLLQYAARACPPLQDVAALERYASPPGIANDAGGVATTSADGISPAAAAAAARLFRLDDDDGHAIKLVRATGLTERLVRQSLATATPCRVLCSDRVWEAIYRLETDGIQAPGIPWVRTTGLTEAWQDVPDVPR